MALFQPLLLFQHLILLQSTVVRGIKCHGGSIGVFVYRTVTILCSKKYTSFNSMRVLDRKLSRIRSWPLFKDGAPHQY